METMNEVMKITKREIKSEVKNETKIEINGVYKTHVGDLVKVIQIDKENDRIHLYNISDGANQWVSLSRALEHKIKTRVR